VTTPARPRVPSVAPRPQLLTYPDSLGGDLATLARLLDGPLAGLFRGVHILPPFPSTADRGFAPVAYREIEPRFGSWVDIERLAQSHDVLLDVMINHISRQSPEFQDYQRHGRLSPHADLFVTVDKVWPHGEPTAADLAPVFLRKPESPLTTITIETTGTTERVWTSFGTEQIDLDVAARTTRELITGWLRTFARHGVGIVRLDAIGYVTKRAGTSCFMVDPDIYEFLAWITTVATELGLTLLPEVHDRYDTHRRLSSHGYWTYDFVLPGMVLEAFHAGRSEALMRHLAASPAKQFTTLDCHDGIPVRPDLDGLLPLEALRQLADRTVERGGNVNRILSALAPGELDVHQLNCTYYAALDRDDDRYIAARAIQLFARGVPQIYYVGLLAGDNDHDAVARTGDGRAINRHDYSTAELGRDLTRPVVRRLTELITLRNTHQAFDGNLRVDSTGGSSLRLSWTHGPAMCTLTVDVATGELDIDDKGGA
jgi:sucrose phosphorylase